MYRTLILCLVVFMLGGCATMSKSQIRIFPLPAQFDTLGSNLVVIDILKDGKFYVNGTEVVQNKLIEGVTSLVPEKARSTKPIIIRSSFAVNYSVVEQIVKELKTAKFNNISIVSN